MYECDMKASVVGVHNNEIIHISKPQSNDILSCIHTLAFLHMQGRLSYVRILQNMFLFKCSDNLKQFFQKKNKKQTKQNANHCVFPSFSATACAYSQQGVRRLHN